MNERGSGRVWLRAPATDDGPALLALARLSRASHRGVSTPPATPAELAAYLRRCREGDGFAAWLVLRAGDDALAGAVSLRHVGAGSGLVGFWLGAPFVGHGYMSEALRLLCGHARASLQLRRLDAEIQPDNARAIATALRAGFHEVPGARRLLKVDGAWRDHHVWSVAL